MNEFEKDDFERDLDFYTSLQYQTRRNDRPKILNPAKLAYENYMSRRYNIDPVELQTMSVESHYAKELSKLEEIAKQL